MIFFKKAFRKNSFSAIELLIVVVTVGLIASFAVASYQGAIQRAYEKDAAANLLAIRSMENSYRSSADTYWPNKGSSFYLALGTTGINANLKMKLTDTDLRYRCQSTTNTFTCEAHHPDFDSNSDWILRITEALGPFCLSGGCPTCGSSECPM